MSFTQTIEVTTTDEQALHDHVAGWHAEQLGLAPGYQGARILADEQAEGRYLIEVEFASRAEAEQNDRRPETAAWATKLGELVAGEPQFRNLRVVCSTPAKS